MPVKKLPALAAKHNMPAVAVTDTNNLFAALEFSVGAAGAGVQPIMGCCVDLGFAPADTSGNPAKPAPLVLLAQNESGYGNLMKLNSALYLGENGGFPQVSLEDLQAFSGGLICLTGGAMGPLGRLVQMGGVAQADALFDGLRAAFADRLYVELQRHLGEGPVPEAERATEPYFVRYAYAHDLPLVATNDVYFPKSEMYEAHDALICIAEGAYVDQQQDRRRLTDQHYFKSAEEMVALFADLPEAIENTVEIARRCAFGAYRRDPILPKFAENEVEELRRQSREGLAARLAVIPHAVSVANPSRD